MRAERAQVAPHRARLSAQLIGLVALNSYFWSPAGKAVCLPVLNCHACTVSATACPIGSITAFALMRRVPFYIIGMLGIVGLSVGRAFCGWLCPFGLLQDALYRLRTRKLRLPRAVNWLKYALLSALVIALPTAVGAGGADRTSIRVVDESAGGLDFCALVCPAGTLSAGLPGLIAREDLRSGMTWKSWMKLALLAVVLGTVVLARRAFCRALCPLGATMALTSRVSLFQLQTDPAKCTRCHLCVAVCPTEARQIPNTQGQLEATAECTMCLDCVRQCPEAGALSARLAARTIMSSRAPAQPRPLAEEAAAR